MPPQTPQTSGIPPGYVRDPFTGAIVRPDQVNVPDPYLGNSTKTTTATGVPRPDPSTGPTPQQSPPVTTRPQAPSQSIQPMPRPPAQAPAYGGGGGKGGVPTQQQPYGGMNPYRAGGGKYGQPMPPMGGPAGYPGASYGPPQLSNWGETNVLPPGWSQPVPSNWNQGSWTPPPGFVDYPQQALFGGGGYGPGQGGGKGGYQQQPYGGYNPYRMDFQQSQQGRTPSQQQQGSYDMYTGQYREPNPNAGGGKAG